MKARIRIAACATAGVLTMGGLVTASAPSAIAATTVRIRVTGIDRSGHRTPVYATIFGTTYPPKFTTPGNAVSVPKGPAWVGTEVDTTTGTQHDLVSATLVMRRVTISRAATITLDARPGKLVKFSLAVPGAQETSETVQGCVGGNFVGGPEVEASSTSPVPLYAVPVSVKGFGFGYDSTWQTAAASYLISGQSTGGIPRAPRYRASPAGMAKVQLALRSGDAIGSYQDIRVIRLSNCGIQQFLPAENPAGSITQYLSSGPYEIWTDGADAFWINNSRYAARHSYSDTFGGAAFGPAQDFPSVWEHEIQFTSESPIGDPQHQSFECCDMSGMTFSYRGHVVKHAIQSQYRATRTFTAHLPAAGSAWYTFQLVGWRRVPGVKVPAGILSPRITMVWHFRTSPQRGVPIDAKFMPVTLTRFVPRGLNLQNQAPPGANTVVAVRVNRPPGRGSCCTSPPKYPLTTVRVQASANGGKTWQTVKLVRQGSSYWLATVPDPMSGYVALRSTVIDSHGDKSVETILRAYAIS